MNTSAPGKTMPIHRLPLLRNPQGTDTVRSIFNESSAMTPAASMSAQSPGESQSNTQADVDKAIADPQVARHLKRLVATPLGQLPNRYIFEGPLEKDPAERILFVHEIVRNLPTLSRIALGGNAEAAAEIMFSIGNWCAFAKVRPDFLPVLSAVIMTSDEVASDFFLWTHALYASKYDVPGREEANYAMTKMTGDLVGNPLAKITPEEATELDVDPARFGWQGVAVLRSMLKDLEARMGQAPVSDDQTAKKTDLAKVVIDKAQQGGQSTAAVRDDWNLVGPMFANFAYPEKWAELTTEVIDTVGGILMRDAGGLLREPVIASLGYGAVTHVEAAHALWRYHFQGIAGARAAFKAVPVDINEYLARLNNNPDLAAQSLFMFIEMSDVGNQYAQPVTRGFQFHADRRAGFANVLTLLGQSNNVQGLAEYVHILQTYYVEQRNDAAARVFMEQDFMQKLWAKIQKDNQPKT